MLLLQLAIILFTSKVAGHFSVRLGQPSVLGKLLIGIILGPSLFGFITNTAIIHQLSQIGVILLMFIAGLETDLTEFKKSVKASIIVGMFGVIAPLVAGYAVGILFGMSILEALFLGLLLAATSVSISVQSLRELGQLQTRIGNTILGAAVIDDILVILALAFVMSLAGGDSNIGIIFLKKLIFFIIIVLVSWKVIPLSIRFFSILKVTQSVLTGGLILCLTFAFFAEYMGVAAIIGSYIAGMSISATKYKEHMYKQTEAVAYSFFVPVFFTSIGLSVQFSEAADNWMQIVMISLLAIVTKLVGCAVGAKTARFGWKESFGIGAAMISRGEVALIISAIGLERGLVGKDLFATIVIVVLVTTLVTPVFMKLFFKKKIQKQYPSQ